MDRRKALKTMGVGAAATLYSSSLLGLLHSCQTEQAAKAGFQPVFFNNNQAFAVEQTLDIILPDGKTPGALALNIPQFLDSYYEKVASKEEQKSIKKQANGFIKQFEKQFDKSIAEGTSEDFLTIVDDNLRNEGKKREELQGRIGSGEHLRIEQESLDFLTGIRYRGMWAWKNSKAIGEYHLWYDPVPGKFIGCAPTSEIGNGKMMSL